MRGCAREQERHDHQALYRARQGGARGTTGMARRREEEGRIQTRLRKAPLMDLPPTYSM